ncbi:cation diffusion facilitator family transporter [Andreprevotia chitinilytica]|uniref:cation diffusion facilitator family transporter n=1 Tax=Andreprevotia chitinilytica TaxID=396808 RepID=UPI0005527961|nr:cation diffusion facilitator family transporter [Andreprevotia chitinilytica]
MSAHVQTNANNARLEQRTLAISLAGCISIAIIGVGYGFYSESNAIILDGFFSLFSVVGTLLNLLTARLITRPDDARFQYGYSHLEPLVNTINGSMMLAICLYAFINGVSGLLDGGHQVQVDHAIAYAAVCSLLCLGMYAMECGVAKKTGSQLVRIDAKEWLLDGVFSFVILIGFAVLAAASDDFRANWGRYVDGVLVCTMALILLPIPFGILRRNVRELLWIAPDEAITGKLESTVARIAAEHDVRDHSTHIAKSGRSYVVEVNFTTGPDFAAQSVAAQDALRQQLWRELDMPLEQIWLSVCFTEQRRWA